MDETVHDIGHDDDDEPDLPQGPMEAPSPGVVRLEHVEEEDEEERMYLVSKRSLNVLTSLVPYKTCQTKDCQEDTTIHEKKVGSALKLNWVSIISCHTQISNEHYNSQSS